METDTARLIVELKDARSEQRLAAVKRLGASDCLNADAIPALIAALHDAERDVRLAAITSLIKIWRGLTGSAGDVLAPSDEIDQSFEQLKRGLMAALRDDDKYVRLSAGEGLRDLFCSDQEVFDVFVTAARDNDESLRQRAALAFWLGATDRRAPLFQLETAPGIALLVGLLQDDSKTVRTYSLRAIASLGPVAETAVPVLRKVLQDENQDMRFKAALALASCGSGGAEALPLLADALANGDRLTRKAAAFALRAMGAEAQPILPALIKGLQDRERRVRSRCAGAIGKIGSKVNDDAVHALLAAERDEDPDVRRAVERALAAIGKEQVHAAQKRATQLEARNFFPLFGFKTEEIPGLIFMLKDANSNTRAMAATALGHLGAQEAVPELIPLLTDEDEDVRRRAAHSLQTMGVGPPTEDA